MLKYRDYPLYECVHAAEKLIAEGAKVHQKWTCRHCHSRQTMSTPNTFFQAGKCEACGCASLIDRCNYLVIKSRWG
jgi:hypothetical protein